MLGRLGRPVPLNRPITIFLIFIYLFIFQRVGEHKQGEWEGEKQASRWAGSLMRGSIPGPWDHDLSRRQTFNDWATQAPLFIIFWFALLWLFLIHLAHFSVWLFVSHQLTKSICILFIYLFLRFCLFERECVSTSRGRGRGRNRLLAEQGARRRTRSQDPGIMTSCPTDWATQASLFCNPN